MSSQRDIDVKWMDAAVRWASRYLGTTADNPTVGALLVDPKFNTLISRAVTAISGRPHAEPQAIETAGEQANGATLYVTLEPCNHHGQTPPCVDAVIAAGVGRVVIGQTDSDARTAGRSINKLADVGIDVRLLAEHSSSAELHKAFFKRIKTGLPFVSAKLAVSADGMVGEMGRGNVAITGAEAKVWTHTLRSRVDAIAVGAKTALIDDPSLNVRQKGLEDRSPRPAIFSTNPDEISARRIDLLVKAETTIADCSVSLQRALKQIGDAGINHLLVEGGPTLINSMLDQNLVDEFHLLESDVIIGATGQPADESSNMRDKLVSAGFVAYQSSEFGADRLTSFKREI